MPKIRFCPQCKNNFSNYSYVTEQKDNKPVNYLVYTCQACLYNERMDTITAASEGVLFSKNNLNKLPDREIHPDMCLDPTLPHTTQVECPNKECQTNSTGADKVKRNVVFFHYNTEMKLAFICCACRSSWV